MPHMTNKVQATEIRKLDEVYPEPLKRIGQAMRAACDWLYIKMVMGDYKSYNNHPVPSQLLGFMAESTSSGVYQVVV